jgi:hypothetical protein
MCSGRFFALETLCTPVLVGNQPFFNSDLLRYPIGIVEFGESVEQRRAVARQLFLSLKRSVPVDRRYDAGPQAHWSAAANSGDFPSGAQAQDATSPPIPVAAAAERLPLWAVNRHHHADCRSSARYWESQCRRRSGRSYTPRPTRRLSAFHTHHCTFAG